jgi:hypothetical protein
MADTLTFDQLLDLAARKGPLEFTIKALGGHRVFVRDPSSADVDEWRMWCRNHQGGDKPMAAKLVQLLLCDSHGDRLVPQTDEALQDLADSNPRAIDEIAHFCLPLVNETTDEAMEEEKKG